jgi:hypothetical protein
MFMYWSLSSGSTRSKRSWIHVGKVYSLCLHLNFDLPDTYTHTLSHLWELDSARTWDYCCEMF